MVLSFWSGLRHVSDFDAAELSNGCHCNRSHYGVVVRLVEIFYKLVASILPVDSILNWNDHRVCVCGGRGVNINEYIMGGGVNIYRYII